MKPLNNYQLDTILYEHDIPYYGIHTFCLFILHN